MIDGLSREQLRFYALHQQRPGDPDLYVVRVLRLRGPLEAPRLARAVASLIARHDALRAVVPLVDGAPRLGLRAELAVPLRCVSAGELPDCLARERRADPPFDLERGPLFSLTLASEDAERHVLILRFHHLICDGASVRRFVEELWAHYDERPPAAPAPSFRDFAAWEAAHGEHARAFWSARLAGAPALDLGAALAAPEPAASDEGSAALAARPASTSHLELPPSLLAALRAFCRAERVTPYAVFAAALAHLLARRTAAREFVIVTPLAARARREWRGALGALIQWIAVRPRLAPGQRFGELVAQLRGDLAGAYDHATDYETLRAAAATEATRPRFALCLNYVVERPAAAPAQLEVRWDPVDSVATAYDLSLRFEETEDRCALGLTAPTAALSAAAVARFAEELLDLTAHLLAHPQELAPPGPAERRTLAIAATFTAEPLRAALEFWLTTLGLPYQLAFAPAGQLLQQLVDPHGLLAHNTLGANALLVRCDDWKDPEAALAELRRLLLAHAERNPAPTLLVLCPPRPEHRAAADLRRWSEALSALGALGEEDGRGEGFSALAASRLHVLRWEDILARYPVAELDDRDGDAYAQAPYSADFTVALATAMARRLCAIATPPPKVIALDCDGTLWRGVVGEDGAHGLFLDESHLTLQALAVARHQDGALLCLASKNEADDVWAAFAQVPGMRLRREHLTAHRIDWHPKSQNLTALADQLGLGVDSFVFLDDSPAECAEVRARCPAALTLELPGEELARRRFLEHLWPLDARKRTDADRARAAMMAAEAARDQARAAAPDLAGFLASLQVQVRFAPLSAATAARAAQLTQRTNQFNTTAQRRSEAELLALDAERLVVDVSDRFGDYGLVGLVVARPRGDALVVDSWLLSCRALGRGVEHQILAELGRRAAAAGLARVDVVFVASAKNRPAALFLDAVGAAHRRGDRYAFPVEVAARAATLPVAPAAAPPTAPTAAAAAPHLPPPRHAPHGLWTTIATELDTVAKIRAAMQRPRAARGALQAPRSDDERAIAAAWCAALDLRELGVDEDYFAVGGDSIRSLAVAAELRRAGLRVTPLELHQHPTVARLAAHLRAGRAPAREPANAADGAQVAADGEAFPLSAAQRVAVEIYARANLREGAPPSGVFHIQDGFAIELRATSATEAVGALRRAFADLIRHTAPLRAQLLRGPDGALWQRPRPLELEAVLPLVPAEALDGPLRPFDPTSGEEPLLRAAVAITALDQLELRVSAHHGFCDGWSLHLAYSRLFALADAYLARDERRAAGLRDALTASGEAYRQLVALERSPVAAAQPSTLPKLPTSDDDLAPGSAASFDHLVARLDEPAVERLRERARQAAVSLKAAVFAAWARALAEPRPIAAVTNRRRAELAQPLDVFGLCWSFAPIAVVDEPGLAELHRRLLDPDAHPGGDLATCRAAFNFVHFHHARWRDGTAHFRVTQRPPRHRFPFPLDLTARLEDALELELCWDARAQLDRPAAAALLQRVLSSLAAL